MLDGFLLSQALIWATLIFLGLCMLAVDLTLFLITGKGIVGDRCYLVELRRSWK